MIEALAWVGSLVVMLGVLAAVVDPQPDELPADDGGWRPDGWDL